MWISHLTPKKPDRKTFKFCRPSFVTIVVNYCRISISMIMLMSCGDRKAHLACSPLAWSLLSQIRKKKFLFTTWQKAVPLYECTLFEWFMNFNDWITWIRTNVFCFVFFPKKNYDKRQALIIILPIILVLWVWCY